jgi:DNA-binding NarL/FixJ family response regulator
MRAAAGLTDARLAFAERRWEDAFDLLAAEDAVRPLGIADLELFAQAASLTARDDEAFVILDRCYALCLASGAELRAANSAFWLGFRLSSLGEHGRAHAWLVRSAEIVDRHGDCVEAGYLLLPRIHRELLAHENDDAQELAARAASIGDRFADPDLSALARQLNGRALIERGDVAAGVGLLDEAMLIATTGAVSELGRGLVYCSVIGCCQRVFAVDRSREWSAVLDSWCASQAQLGIFNGTCRVHRAEILQFGGNWDAALREAQAVASGIKADDRERSAAHYEEAEIHRLHGEFEAAQRLYELASSLGGDSQPGLALLRLAQGEVALAVHGIRRAVATSSSALGRARLLPAVVEIMLAAGARSEAADAAGEMAGIATEYGTVVLAAVSADMTGHVLMDSGQPADAVPLLTRALETWSEVGAPYAAARTRALLAEAFESLNDLEGAQLHRDAARAVFTRLGAVTDLAVLARVGQSDGAGGLTGRELEILRLASSGMTNKSIGLTLHLSTRTIDRHLSNILAKLQVPSRTAATAFAYEHSLIQRQNGAG